MKRYVEINVNGKWLGHREFKEMGLGAQEVYICNYPDDTIETRSTMTGRLETLKPGDRKWSLGVAVAHFPEHIRIVEEA